MALTKVGKEGITGISNASDATFLTATSSEGVTFSGTLTSTGTLTASGNTSIGGTLGVTGVHTVGNNAIFGSEGGAVTQNLVQGLVKTWVSVGGGTMDVDDSLNVSSRDDDSTGQTGINMTKAFNSANVGYAVTVSQSSMVSGRSGIRTENKANGAFDITCVANNTNVDPDFVHAQCTGDLA